MLKYKKKIVLPKLLESLILIAMSAQIFFSNTVLDSVQITFEIILIILGLLLISCLKMDKDDLILIGDLKWKVDFA